MQQIQKQPQFGETVDNLTLSGFKLNNGSSNEQVTIYGKITQFMVNEQGVASLGALTMIISNTATIAARKILKWQSMIEDCCVYQLRELNVDEEVEVTASFLTVGKRFCKLEVTMTAQNELCCKALLSLRGVKK